MNHQPKGGASRPGRRRALKLGALIFISAVLLVAIRDSHAGMFNNIFEPDARSLAEPDSVYARELLAAVRGANGVLCSAVDHSFQTGGWSTGLTSIIETDFADQRSADVTRWIGKRHYDVSVLAVARRALGDDDACVRRVGARIAGGVATEDLHERLRGELASAQPGTRAAAAFALGFADNRTALPALQQRLTDSDRNVRVAAIWALGTIGDAASSATMAALLERDPDPVVRSAAAWALGRIHD